MRAGTMRRQIVIQQSNATQNTSGDPIPAWETFATVRAAIVPLQGRELLAAQQIVASVSHRLDMRYVVGVTPAMRVTYDGRYFDIQAAIDPTELKREMQLFCLERVGQD
jgi:SPP1 family predicted phage head-tail adaptor